MDADAPLDDFAKPASVRSPFAVLAESHELREQARALRAQSVELRVTLRDENARREKARMTGDNGSEGAAR